MASLTAASWGGVWAGTAGTAASKRVKASGMVAAFIMVSVAVGKGLTTNAVQGAALAMYLTVHFFWFDLADNTTSFSVMATILYPSPFKKSSAPMRRAVQVLLSGAYFKSTM